jgi:hypothetical protein
MNRLFIIFFFLATHFSCAQKTKWNQVIVESKSSFSISKEGKIVNTLFDNQETRDTIKSSLILNNDTLFTILFTKAKLNGDTLSILIHQDDPAYHQEYLITVLKNKYNINYVLSAPVDPEKSKMVASETKLILNSFDYKKGKEIRGYTEYKGRCVKGCFEGDRPVTVKGNFVALIE